MKIIKVDWIDASTIWEVLTEQELKEKQLIEVTTIGYLVDENEHRIAMASMVNREAENIFFKTSHLIPKCLVKNIEVLKNIT